MSKNIIHSEQAPKAIGPYSQAVRAGDFVYTSGQIPLDPHTGELINGEFRDHVKQVFNNLDAICRAAGGNLGNIIKLNVYLTDLENFTALNEVMMEIFTAPYPARSAVAVSRLPKDVAVEIEAVLYFG